MTIKISEVAFWNLLFPAYKSNPNLLRIFIFNWNLPSILPYFLNSLSCSLYFSKTILYFHSNPLHWIPHQCLWPYCSCFKCFKCAVVSHLYPMTQFKTNAVSWRGYSFYEIIWIYEIIIYIMHCTFSLENWKGGENQRGLLK